MNQTRCPRCDAYGYHEPWCSSMLGEPEAATGVLPDKSHDIFEGTETTKDADTWRNAAQTLAADNARLCSIALAADKLAEQVSKLLHESTTSKRAIEHRVKRLHDALGAYTIARNGQ